jgi:hypothetical protein
MRKLRAGLALGVLFVATSGWAQMSDAERSTLHEPESSKMRRRPPHL